MSFDLGERAGTALLVMDMQNDIIHERAESAVRMGFAAMVKECAVIDRVRDLLGAFREARLPIVHVVVDFSAGRLFQMPCRGHFFQAISSGDRILQKGSWGAAIHDDLAPQRDEPIIGKGLFSSFAGTRLHEVLRAKGVTQVVLAGVATDFVVDATAWSASDLGYDVIIVDDGCCSSSVEKHRDSLARMAARADIVDTRTILAAMSRG